MLQDEVKKTLSTHDSVGVAINYNSQSRWCQPLNNAIALWTLCCGSQQHQLYDERQTLLCIDLAAHILFLCNKV